jgi:SAM-dependent methyltransferase
MNTRLDKEELWPEKLPNSFKNRVKGTIDYLSKEGYLGNVADCGEENPMKLMIEDQLNIKINSINYDFNYPYKAEDKYDTILCFEVLEHLFNPLLFLEQLKMMLNENGVIYVSTPYHYPQFLKTSRHYHEIPSDRILWLFDAAKLKVLDKKNISCAGNWYNHLYGIRPILRYFQNTRIYKLKG